MAGTAGCGRGGGGRYSVRRAVARGHRRPLPRSQPCQVRSPSVPQTGRAWECSRCFAVVALSRQPTHRTRLQLHLSLNVTGHEPPAKRAQRVHDAVGVLMRSRLVTRPIRVFKNSDPFVLENNLVVLRIGGNGIEAHTGRMSDPRPPDDRLPSPTEGRGTGNRAARVERRLRADQKAERVSGRSTGVRHSRS